MVTPPAAVGVSSILTWTLGLQRPRGTPKSMWRAVLVDSTHEMADAAANEDWVSFVLSAPTRYRLNVCALLLDAGVRPVELREPLREAWMEAIRPDEVMSIAGIVALFRRVGYFSDDGSERPAGALRLFRGASVARARGLAWTVDPAIATLFASYFGAEGQVFMTVAPPDALLAHFARAGEDEYIVDPAALAIRLVAGQGELEERLEFGKDLLLHELVQDGDFGEDVAGNSLFLQC